jgi:uncharacterized protein YndB with AHSA1/START domain
MSPPKYEIKRIDAGCERFVLKARFPHFTPELLFNYWIKPELLHKWWSGDIQVIARLGGGFCLPWLETHQSVMGTYTYFEHGKRLAFTWHWSHEWNPPRRSIALGFRPSTKGGASLMLMAGLYDRSAESRKQRRDHMDCWAYFLTRLHMVEGVRD